MVCADVCIIPLRKLHLKNPTWERKLGKTLSKLQPSKCLGIVFIHFWLSMGICLRETSQFRLGSHTDADFTEVTLAKLHYMPWKTATSSTDLTIMALTTNGNDEISCKQHLNNSHPDCFLSSICARKIISEGKAMVKENRFISTKEVLATIENRATTTSLDGAYLGPSSNLKRRLTDTRMKQHGSINLGKTKEDLFLPPELQKTTDDRRFLLYDNNQGPNRMIIFASDDALDVSTICELTC